MLAFSLLVPNVYAEVITDQKLSDSEEIQSTLNEFFNIYMDGFVEMQTLDFSNVV
jgi:hypothetical protein